MAKGTDIKVGGKTLKLSNLDKVLYPATGTTKGDVLRYYAAVAPALIPHVARRPLTLKRYPHGVDGEFFYEKQCPTFRPEWINTYAVPRERKAGEVNYCVLTDAASLVWVANLASIEIHVLLSVKPRVLRPTAIAFDLDPGPGLGVLDCAEAAASLRAALAVWNLRAFPKTSGKKGLHVYVPLNSAVTFDDTKPFAHAVARGLEQAYPDRFVSNMRKELRKGKIFVDWSQNDAHKTTVAPYSLRATERPCVSTPVTWEELDEAVRTGRAESLFFSPDDALRRVSERGDLFAPVETLRQKLPRDTPDVVVRKIGESARAGARRPKKRLSVYRQKRDFTRTPEPSDATPAGASGEPRFVIQKHDATRLHYDFRLEVNGALASWAVPKGPSTDPKDRRLAVRTEDHPMAYAGFEGVIPEGEYGAGPVIVWDEGTYVNVSSKNGSLLPMEKGLEKGHVDIWLKGRKLNGAWTLTRINDDQKSWILVKRRDAGALRPPNPVLERPESVLTGRTIEDVERDPRARTWHSNR